MKEPDAHLLFNIRSVEGVAELFESDALIAILVRLHDGPVGDASQLLIRNICTDHHVKNGDQLLPGNLLVIVQVVHLEGEPELLFAAVELVLLALLDWLESGEDTHKLAEVNSVIVRFGEEGLDNAVAEWIDGQLWNSQEVFAAQRSIICLI